MKYQTLAIIFFATILFSCKESSHFQIKGTISGAQGDTIFLKELTNEPYGIKDSILLDKNNSFRFEKNIVRPTFFSVYLNPKSNISLIVYPGDKIEIAASAPDLLSSLMIEGSEESVAVNELFRKRNEAVTFILKQIDNIYAIKDTDHLAELAAKYDTAIEKRIAEHRNYSIDFVEKNIHSPICIIALQQSLGDRLMFSPDSNFEYFMKADSVLYKKYPTAEAVKFIHEQVVIYKHIYNAPNIGKKAPDIALPDTAGKTRPLSAFRGHYVLLEFWASWCKPCRQDNPYLLWAYRKFHWKGFEIFQVSLDQSADAWKQAIRADQMYWTHVSDLKMWNSVVVPQYRIESTPANFLINPEGIIIAKNIPGTKLDKVLTDIYYPLYKPAVAPVTQTENVWKAN